MNSPGANLGEKRRGQMDSSCAGDRWANVQSRPPTWINLGRGHQKMWFGTWCGAMPGIWISSTISVETCAKLTGVARTQCPNLPAGVTSTDAYGDGCLAANGIFGAAATVEQNLGGGDLSAK